MIDPNDPRHPPRPPAARSARLLVEGRVNDLSGESVLELAKRLLRVEGDLADVVNRAHEQALIVKPFHDKAPTWRKVNEPPLAALVAYCRCGQSLPHETACEFTTDPEAM